jgi:hypothetical protein
MRYARTYPSVTDFPSIVATSLYATPPKLSGAANGIPALDRVKRICCFNFDDLLDRAFVAHDRAYRPVFAGQPYDLSSPETLVFCPHGYLPDPQRPSHPRTPAIILSEDNYFLLANEPSAWTNTLQDTLLLNMTALFVGCSLIDPNIRRLLYNAARKQPGHQHYAILPVTGQRENPQWYQEDEAAAYKNVQTHLLRDLGIRPLWLRNFEHLPTILDALRSPTPNTLDDTARP